MLNNSYSASVTELQQPHRYAFRGECSGNPPCGWQSHQHSEAEAVAIMTSHLVGRHGFTVEQASKAVTVTRLASNPAVPMNPDVPPAGDKSRTNAVTPATKTPARAGIVTTK